MMEKHHYVGNATREITFPLGGIGAGSIGLGGNGRLIEWEIKNRPDKGTLNGKSHFAVKAEAGGKVIGARVLQGDLLKDYIGQTGMPQYGMGINRDSMVGFPHFKNCDFQGEFPIARLKFDDPSFPAPVEMMAFNPLIPLDEDASSIPAAFFEISMVNPLDEDVTFTTALSVNNMFGTGINKTFTDGNLKGVRLYQETIEADSPAYGELAIAADTTAADDVNVQEYWFRGGWFDAATIFWQEFNRCGAMPERTYDTTGNPWETDVATLQLTKTLKKGEKASFRFVISWNFPNNYNYWDPDKTEDGKDKTWKNYYAVLFKDAIHSATHSLKNWDSLYSRTEAFRKTLFDSTLPDVVIEAASANLAVLKSPTVFRLEDGSFYGWEGTYQTEGSCEGSCAHVWAYAYAAPYLFPALERSMRYNEYTYSLADTGKVTFRLNLPLGRAPKPFHACVDGQMGSILKTYFDWKYSGNDEWLKQVWPAVKKSLEYAWNPGNEDRWDLNKDGVLEGRQHHTLDMELFGPSSWLQGFYMGALKAAAEMAEYLGENDKAAEYRDLFAKGTAYCEENLFNGEYYVHKVDLKDKAELEKYMDSTVDGVNVVALYWNPEAEEIKYQIDQGCSIDQVTAQWHADLSGLGDIYDRTHLKTALKNLYKNNFVECMRDYFNPCRIYALNDEQGTIICGYPEGAPKPVVPIPYTQEAMHGFEYQAGAQMINNGMIEEGLKVVQAVRDRYTGEFRSPWNEIECGSNYARSMASYTLIPIMSGFSFDLPKKQIGFDPLVWQDDTFSCIWSVGTAWGKVEITKDQVKLHVEEGAVTLKAIRLPFLKDGVCPTVVADGNAVAATYTDGQVVLSAEANVAKELVIRW